MKNKILLTCLLALFTLTAVSQTRPINPLRIETGEITALNLGADSLLSLSHKVGDGAIYVNDTTLEDWVGQYASANPAGATTQIQYNNAGAFGASANLTTDGGSLAVDNVTIDGNTISTTNTNGNLALAPNGTGVIAAVNGINTGTNSFVIKPNTTFGSDDNSLTISAGGDVGHLRGAYIQINGNQVGSFLDGAIRYHTGNNTTHSKHVFWTSGSAKFQITNNGSVVAGSPTGAGKGFGTINAQGIFINDVAVSAGAHTTINTNADNRIITGSDTDNTLNGEADLTFSGGVLGVIGSLAVDSLTLNDSTIATTSNADLVLAPNGTGILDVQSDATFSGDVSLSDNALQDVGSGTVASGSFYETGTFTPVVADNATAGNTATGTFSGSYTRIGKSVTIVIELVDISTTGMTGGNSIFIRGLPFSPVRRALGTVRADNFTFATSTLFAQITSVGPYFLILGNSSASALTIYTVAGISTGVSDIYFSCTYETTY